MLIISITILLTTESNGNIFQALSSLRHNYKDER